MIETPISFLQIDTPAGGATLPCGRHAVQGWLMPKLRGGFADVRAIVGEDVFPGLLGFPRADLAAHFQTGRPRELAGFQLNLDLRAGVHRVRFEALQIEGVWQEVGALDLTGDPALPPVDFPVPTAPVRGREFGLLLQALMTEADASTDVAALADRWVARAPFPRDLLRPNPPFFGAMDAPVALVAAADGFVDVRGHLFHAGARIRGVSVSADLQALQPLVYGEPSPEAAARHPRHGNARECGYSGRVFVPSQLPDPVPLRLYAELGDGSHVLVQVARIQRSTAEQLTRPFNPSLTPHFDEAVTALRRAIARRQLALVTDAVYEAELARLRDAVRAPAPRPARAPLVELENTFVRPSGSARTAAGLPPAGILVAGLVSRTHPEVAAGLTQAMALLQSRHPALAREAHLVLAGNAETGIARANASTPALSEEDALRLADLTVRTADPGAEGLPAGDIPALAEALARRIYRLRRELSEMKAAP